MVGLSCNGICLCNTDDIYEHQVLIESLFLSMISLRCDMWELESTWMLQGCFWCLCLYCISVKYTQAWLGLDALTSVLLFPLRYPLDIPYFGKLFLFLSATYLLTCWLFTQEQALCRRKPALESWCVWFLEILKAVFSVCSLMCVYWAELFICAT